MTKPNATIDYSVEMLKAASPLMFQRVFPVEEKQYSWYVKILRQLLRMSPEMISILPKLPDSKGRTIKFRRYSKLGKI